MVALASLLLPIVLSAVAVFIVSSIMHMAVPLHKDDMSTLPREDDVQAALRPFAIAPGDYMLPRPASMAAMKDPGFTAKLDKGPVILMTVLPSGRRGMGAQLAQWFIYCLVISLFSAYLAAHSLASGTPYLAVFRIAGTAAFMGYGLALWQESIWYKRRWSTTLKYMVDALLYAGTTAGVFGWLWPR